MPLANTAAKYDSVEKCRRASSADVKCTVPKGAVLRVLNILCVDSRVQAVDRLLHDFQKKFS
jgi:hypothetical protein